jgi:uncharacterized protein (TIGR00255 family)
MKSMTGYGKSNCELNNKTITLEIKALNSKQLDIYTRIPSIYREKDLDMRNIISKRLKRGKVELSLTIDITDAKNAGIINIPVVKDYYRQLQKLGDEIDIDYKESVLQVIMRLPESLKLEKDELNTEEWKKIETSLQKALDSVDEFRLQEGNALKKDILSRVENISNILETLTPYEEERLIHVRQRLTNGMNELKEADKVDTNRFEQELVYYLEKLDINEEKVRLKNHCSFFKEVAEYDEPMGKKLGFIAQEMGREINTIGSKANHTEIQRLVVSMKDELEKIKEQSLNIL